MRIKGVSRLLFNEKQTRAKVVDTQEKSNEITSYLFATDYSGVTRFRSSPRDIIRI